MLVNSTFVSTIDNKYLEYFWDYAQINKNMSIQINSTFLQLLENAINPS